MGSAEVVQGAVQALLGAVDHGVHVAEALKKLPDYNVMYSVDLATHVNDVAIKRHDVNKDDNTLHLDASDEPQPARLDLFD